MESLDIDLTPEVLKVLRREYESAKEKHPIFAGSLYQAVSIVAEELGAFAQAVNDGDTDEALTEAAVDYARARNVFTQLKEQSLHYLKKALT